MGHLEKELVYHTGAEELSNMCSGLDKMSTRAILRVKNKSLDHYY